MIQAQCRFCGVYTKNNKYLFDNANLEYLKMAMTIYPVVIHQSDPLPKYVCDVCQSNTCKQFESRRRIIELNNQWVNNLRYYEPQHGYLSLLETIEDIKKFVIDNNKLEVKGILKQCVARMLSYEKKDLNIEELNNCSSSSSSNTSEEGSELNNESSSSSNTSEERSGKSNNKTEIEKCNSKSSSSRCSSKEKSELYNKRNSNTTTLEGCETEIPVEQQKTPVNASSIKEYIKGNLDLPTTSANAEIASPVDSVASGDTSTTTTSTASKKTSNLKSMISKKSRCTFVTYNGTTIKIKTLPKRPPSNANVKSTGTLAQADQQKEVEKELIEKPNTNLIHTCKICQSICTSVEDLIKHQTKEHLQLKLHRIFQKKTLPSSFRRGRVMKVDDEKNILRCLSCYRVYENNGEILEHWTNCKCDFYCLICKETYPESPKFLREHVRQKHGINHNQLRLLHEINNEAGTIELTPAPAPLTIRRTIANAKCSTCCRVFASKEARELHMLTHKPNYIRKEKPEVPSNIIKHKPAKCKCCSKSFEHIRALNAHMRVHKQSFSYGTLTLPTNDKKNMTDKYMVIEVDPDIVVKNEACIEDNVTTNIISPHKELLAAFNTFSVINSSPSPSSSPLQQKGLIKVKAMHELMNIHPPPAKIPKLDTFENWG